MGVVKEARTESTGNSITTKTFSHAHPSGLSNSLLVLSVHSMKTQTGSIPFTVTSATYNGVSMTELGYQQNATTNRNYLQSVWYLINPPAGTYDVVANLSASIGRNTFEAISFSGVDQTTPLQLGTQGISDGPWSGTFTLPTVDSQIWFGLVVRADTVSVTAGTGNTKEFETFNTATASGSDTIGALVYKSFGSSGSQTLSGISGPTAIRGVTYQFFAVNAAVTTNALTTGNTDSGTPVVDSPTLGQKHVFGVSNVSAGVPTLAPSALGQKHTLTIASVSAGTPTVGIVGMVLNYLLTIASVSSGVPTFSVVGLGQKHTLSVASVSAGVPTVGQGALTQKHTLSLAAVSTPAPIIGVVSLGQKHGLAVNHILAGVPTVATPQLILIHALTVANIVAGVPTITFMLFYETPKQRTIVLEADERTAYLFAEDRSVVLPNDNRTLVKKEA